MPCAAKRGLPLNLAGPPAYKTPGRGHQGTLKLLTGASRVRPTGRRSGVAGAVGLSLWQMTSAPESRSGATTRIRTVDE
jgi:hypothetical protein